MNYYDGIALMLLVIGLLLTNISIQHTRIRKALEARQPAASQVFREQVEHLCRTRYAVKPVPRGPLRKPGDRVRAKHNAGFHAGATGTVVFQEPAGFRCWIERDGSDSPVWYHNGELEDAPA